MMRPLLQEAEPTDDGPPADGGDASADKDQKWNWQNKADWKNKDSWNAEWQKGGKSKGGKGVRDRPYDRPSSKADLQLATLGRNPNSTDFVEAMAALTRAESASRTAARVARSAALAFDEEAAILAFTTKKISDLFGGGSSGSGRRN